MREQSPVRLLVILIASILASECVIRLLLNQLGASLSEPAELIIDLVLLVGFLLPALYTLVLSPLIRNLNERREAELALRESEFRFRFLATNLQDIIWEMDGELRFTFVSSYVKQILGFDPEEIVGLKAATMLSRESRLKFAATMEEIFAVQRDSGELATTRTSKYELLRKDGSTVWVETRSTTIFGDDNLLQKIVGVARDITDRVLAETALNESYQLLQKTIASLNEAVFIVNTQDRRIIDLNLTAEKMFRYSRDEMIGAHTSILHLHEEGSRQFAAEMLKSYEEKGYFETTFQMKRKDGSIFASEHSVTPIIGNDGTYLRHVCVVRDITERIKSEELMRRSLQEKGLLIKEIHHRVRNNLQLIASLLQLQQKYFTDEFNAGLYLETRNRIDSLAIIYQMLCSSDNLAEINLAVYCRRLVAILVESHRIDTNVINLCFRVADIMLDVDTAIPCGLILHELVDNAFKHAFIGGTRKGTLTIATEDATDGILVLTMKDDGVGLPPLFDISRTDTLGLRLVRLLVEQLEGNLTILHDNGVGIRVVFPFSGSNSSLEETCS